MIKNASAAQPAPEGTPRDSLVEKDPFLFSELPTLGSLSAVESRERPVSSVSRLEIRGKAIQHVTTKVMIAIFEKLQAYEAAEREGVSSIPVSGGESLDVLDLLYGEPIVLSLPLRLGLKDLKSRTGELARVVDDVLDMRARSSREAGPSREAYAVADRFLADLRLIVLGRGKVGLDHEVPLPLREVSDKLVAGLDLQDHHPIHELKQIAVALRFRAQALDGEELLKAVLASNLEQERTAAARK